MTSASLSTLVTKIDGFYTKFVSGRGGSFSPTSSIFDIAAFSANGGYASATRQKAAPLSFKGKTVSQKALPRTVCTEMIKDFLVDFDAHIYSAFDIEQKIVALMDDIIQIYDANGFPDFTYGNAQKWVNMSFKYYFVIKAHLLLPTSKNKLNTLYDIVKSYSFFPIDKNMIMHIKRDFPTCRRPIGPWSKNNILSQFIDCWHDIAVECVPDYDKPLFYEIYVW